MLIIYFSIGAPLGVYSYFQKRPESSQNNSLLKTGFTFLFWFPAAFNLIKNKAFRRRVISAVKPEQNFSVAVEEKQTYSVQKQLEKIICSGNCGVSIFEFREIFERYAGLTFAAQNHDSAINNTAREFFKISENKNAEIGAKCFDRRNRQRLFFHQTGARKDFLQLIAHSFTAVSDKREFIRLIIKFTDLLKDLEAREKVGKIFRVQTEKHLTAKLLETDLWKPEPLTPSRANSISTLL